MSKNLGLRSAIYAILTIVALIYLVPTFSSNLPDWWSKALILPTEKVKLGLDLQGGMRLVMEVQVDKAVESELELLTEEIKDSLREKKIKYADIKLNSTKGIDLTLLKDEDMVSFQALQSSLYPDYVVVQGQKTENGRVVSMNMKPAAILALEKSATDQAKETISTRIDQYGLREPEVTADTDKHRILIQLPGEKDPDRAINIIKKTALLEFKLVDEENNVEDAIKGNIPVGDEVLYMVDRNTGGETTKTPLLVKKRTSLTGEYITDAKVNLDSTDGRTGVSLSFNDKGARIFEKITGENVNKRLAIILDNTIYSAPNISEKISGGEARITGNFTSDEANDLRIVLKAGALKAPVKILERRTVGASLGQDSINKGIKSMIIGGALVVLFMVVYYGFAGFIADLALILNTIFITAGLALFGATLTLPGLAGMILMIGMAVDTNVLIYERTREELRLGKTLRMAIDTGYAKTMVTIIDTHVTTFIAGMVLFQFGTGPVKGFAVTLTIGLVANFLTAIFITRVAFDYLIIERKWKKISI